MIVTNEELERRVAKCAEQIADLVNEISESNPDLEQAVALGALLSALVILRTLIEKPTDVNC